ncbi:MAG TPA: BON domain-containing protein [Oligoflexia bacterium]|nr:BON domain-containing protein [Oligoflexia bacterium]HMP27212.1 BON domain-containing protein [Oligoflexia bacterium]
MIKKFLIYQIALTLIISWQSCLADDSTLLIQNIAKNIKRALKDEVSYEINIEVTDKNQIKIDGFVSEQYSVEAVNKIISSYFSERSISNKIKLLMTDQVENFCDMIGVVLSTIANQKIRVDCENNVLYLSGSTESRQIAIQIANYILSNYPTEIISIKNFLVIPEKGGVEDNNIKKNIDELFEKSQIYGIHFTVKDQTVTIGGEIESRIELNEFLNQLGTIPGIEQIYDKTNLSSGVVATINSSHNYIIETASGYLTCIYNGNLNDYICSEQGSFS